MAYFSASDQRTRYKSTERILETTREVLVDPAVATALGEVASELLTLHDEHFYIPNVKHGVILRPQSIKGDEAIPVVSLFPEESLYISPELLELLPSQKAQLAAHLRAHGITESGSSDDEAVHEIQTAMIESRANSIVDLPPHAAAGTALPAEGIGLVSDDGLHSVEFQLISRPIVTYKVGSEKDPIAASNGVHEDVHVTLAFDNAVHPYDATLFRRHLIRQELQAYHIQERAGVALYHASQNPKYYHNHDRMNPAAGVVESLRKRLNVGKEDPFDPSDELYDLILTELGDDILQ